MFCEVDKYMVDVIETIILNDGNCDGSASMDNASFGKVDLVTVVVYKVIGKVLSELDSGWSNRSCNGWRASQALQSLTIWGSCLKCPR